jgi:hypothetical protein
MGIRAAGLNNEGSFTPDELLVSCEQSGLRTYATGHGVVARGTVLGKITASGKLIPSASAAADGSQTPYAVAAEDVDTTNADADGVAYLAATLNQNSLVYGAGHTAATVFDPLRAVDIHLVKAQH